MKDLREVFYTGCFFNFKGIGALVVWKSLIGFPTDISYDTHPGGVLDFGLDGGVPPEPRDPNPCLEVKKVPMFRDFAQKMDPCLGIFCCEPRKFLWFWRKMDPCLGIWGSKMRPMFRDFFVKNQPIWAALPRIAFLWKYSLEGILTLTWYMCLSFGVFCSQIWYSDSGGGEN